MNTPKRLLSGSDDPSVSPATRKRSRSPDDELIRPISDQIEQVARRHRVPSDTVKRIVSDLLNESTVIDYLRTRIIPSVSSMGNQFLSSVPVEGSMLSPSSCFDSSLSRPFLSTRISTDAPSSTLPTDPQQHLLSTTTMVDEYDPLWLEFIQSLNAVESNASVPHNTTQSTMTFDSLFNNDDDDDDDDDEEFIGPDDENHLDHADDKKLRVSKRELALLLKDSNTLTEDIAPHPDEEILRGDQYESLWTEFLASLQHENNQQQDEQPKSILTSTEDDDNDDDPEFRLAETDYDVEDDLEDELHVSRRELALLLEDNASILNADDVPTSNPESVSSTATGSIISKSFEFRLTSTQRDILQYQLSAYVQLLTQYILLRRETDPLSPNCQSAQQLFKDLLYFRDKQPHSILDIPPLGESQRVIESPPSTSRRKALGNHLSFHLMDTFCKHPAFVHDSLLPTCLLSSSSLNSFSQAALADHSRNFVSGEDGLMGLGLEQGNATMLIIGHGEKAIRERLDSLRYARVRRGKQNPVKAFFTYGSVPDISLAPWYSLPHGFDINQIYPNGLIEKANVVFPPWFRLSYKRSRQLSKRDHPSLLSTSSSSAAGASTSMNDPDDAPSSSTVYVVVEGSSPSTRATSPKKVLQQIHMLHLLNSYPKLQPKQHQP